MNTTQANKAGQNHAELVKAAVQNGAHFAADHAKNMGTYVRDEMVGPVLYGIGATVNAVVKPVAEIPFAAADGAQVIARHAGEKLRVARSYAVGFFATLLSR